MKKEKKQKEIVHNLVLGNKIRDVKLNDRQHFLMFVSMLVSFNLLLVISIWFVLDHLNNWYYWVICFAILGLSSWLSFRTFRDTKVFNKCELFDNAISINSIWLNVNIELKDIFEMNVKELMLDKIFKLNTKSLEIKFLGHRRKKIYVHFVEEDAVKLKQEITMLIDRYMETLKGVNENKEKTSED